MKTYQSQYNVFRIVIDLFLVGIVFLLSTAIAHREFSFPLNPTLVYNLIVFGLVWYIAARTTGLYEEFRSRDFSYEFVILLKTLTLHMIGVVFFLFILKELVLTREFVLIYGALALIFLGSEKYLVRQVLERIRAKGKNIRRVVIVGAGYVGKRFQQLIAKNPQYGYRFIGYLDEKPRTELNGEYLGHIDLLEDILNEKKVDDVVIALPSSSRNSIEQVIRTCENFPVHIRILPDYVRFLSPKFRMSMFDTFPVISVRNSPLEEVHWRFIKRVFDIVFTVSLCVTLFWWLWPIIALAIKLTSKGPVFFKQERWGEKNQRIVCYKFRSMVAHSTDVDETGKYRQAKKNDPRITPIGRFLRETNLDELPQFLNVLRGEMSVVGPRPHPTPLNLESKDSIQYYMRRHMVKPGVTGWAQVNGFRGETTDPRLMQKRIEYDIWYIENWSFLLDIQIIIMTVMRMVKGDPMAY